ncbi:MAG: MGMT family protein [Candidatus Bathyarchaeota archaeon]|nr:MGMT family protein [Candidatus Bathyarchaeota archaeon]
MNVKSIATENDLVTALKDKTPFERDVYVATFKIPKGCVSTYKRIAEKIGRPKAYRAVANALHKNPLWPVVPCHRVVSSNGSFSGDKRGADVRRSRVKREGIPVKKGKVVLSRDILF